MYITGKKRFANDEESIDHFCFTLQLGVEVINAPFGLVMT